MKRTAKAIATAFVLALLATSSTFAWQSRIEGRPESFRAGARAGVYIWHEDPVGLRVRTTDPIGQSHEYTGTITTDGTFTNISIIQLDPNDSYSLSGGSVLSFDFHTGSGIDGIDYDIQGGTGERVYIQWDGNDIPVGRVYLGRQSEHPLNDPMLFCRNDNNGCENNVPGIPGQ